MELLGLRARPFGILIAVAQLPSIWAALVGAPSSKGQAAFPAALATGHVIQVWTSASFMVKSEILGKF